VFPSHSRRPRRTFRRCRGFACRAGRHPSPCSDLLVPWCNRCRPCTPMTATLGRSHQVAPWRRFVRLGAVWRPKAHCRAARCRVDDRPCPSVAVDSCTPSPRASTHLLATTSASSSSDHSTHRTRTWSCPFRIRWRFMSLVRRISRLGPPSWRRVCRPRKTLGALASRGQRSRPHCSFRSTHRPAPSWP
jgi:hypothetical protein